MNKLWVPIVAGSAALLVAGLLVKHYFGSEDAELEQVQEQRLAAVDERVVERSGWAAKPDAGGGSVGSRKSGGAGATGGSAGKGADGRGIAGDPDSAAGSGGQADAMYGSRRRSSVESGSGAGPSASGAIDVAANVRDPLRFEGPQGLQRDGAQRGGLSLPGLEVPGEAGTGEDGDQADEDGLVLSLPLEESAQPDKGDTAPVVEEGVSFDSEGMKFSADSQFVVPDGGNIKGEAGTISFWINPEWDPNDGTDASLVQLREPHRFENRLQITKNGQFLRFIFADNTGSESGAGYQMNWAPGEPHLVTATWGEALTTLYVDGQRVGQQTYTGQLDIRPGTPLYIGSDYPGAQPGARATMSQFKVYNRPLTPDEVVNNLAQRSSK